MEDKWKLVCCGQEIKLHHKLVKDPNKANELGFTTAFYYCEKCGQGIRVYPSSEVAKKTEKEFQEKSLVNFWKNELDKRGYYVIKKDGYEHHGEILLNKLKEELSDTEMKILGEIKGDQAIIYLQPDCCGDFKLPLIQVPANTKNIKYFDYLGIGWFEDEKDIESTLKDIWEDRDKSSLLGTDFPKAKTELMEELKNKDFLWEGGEEKDNYIKAICPRCEWVYNCELTERYMKVEEQKEMEEAVKNHEC